MAARLRIGWMIAGTAAVMLGALFLWAWNDAGLRPLSPQVAPALLPQVTR